MGLAALILGCGDAFHLVPRVLNYFADGDFTAALGIGKLVTSVTMTVFYVLMYYIRQGYYREKKDSRTEAAVWALAALRTALCLFPQNSWLENQSNLTWGIIRNVPFVLLGALIIVLYFKKRRADGVFRPVWLLILLTFLFLYPGGGRSGAVAHPRHADASQDNMLYPDHRLLPARGKKPGEDGLPLTPEIAREDLVQTGKTEIRLRRAF